MRENPLHRVRWIGTESLPEVREKLLHHGCAEIQLAPDYHHALYRRFHPGETPVSAELLRVSDGAELLAKASTVRGLEDLESVENLARETGAHVELVSPVPLISLTLEHRHS